MDDERAWHILAVLQQHNVAYVVVGGYAALLYGVAHVTDDIDITPTVDTGNLDRLAAALNELGARFRVEGYPEGYRPPVRIDARVLSRAEWSTFVTSHGNLDVMLRLDGVGGYADLVSTSETMEPAPRLSVRVIALRDLLTAKQAAARPKDQAIIPLLEAAARRRGLL
jgi:hypothetical protein